MGKLNLVAMSYDKDALLNALQRTGATEIKYHFDAENTTPMTADCEGLRESLAAVESSLALLSSCTEEYLKEHKIKSEILKDGFSVSYSEFIAANEKQGEVASLVEKINELSDRERDLNAELSKLRRTLKTAEIYSAVQQPLNYFSDTLHVKVKLGVIPATVKGNFLSAIENCGLACVTEISANAEEALVLVTEHKSSTEAESLLPEYGFAVCPFNGENTGEELYNSLCAREKQINEDINSVAEEFYSLSENIRTLKVYCDYLSFELEKAEQSEKMRETQSTFLLEAYVPKEAEELVQNAISEVSSAVYFEFSEPSEDEVPPTLLKNNPVVENFEAITNMYSPPSSREFDPNTVMAFFYSVFIGFIMADIGYGLLMILGGGFIWLKMGKKGGMIGKLGGVFAIGGIFTIIWGFLFNSLFGFALLPFKVMPDLRGDAMSWSLAGIKVPALLIVSMLIGVVQLGAGYLCKAVQCWRRKQVLDGIFDGLVWTVFSVGVELAIAGFVEEFNVSILRLIGGATAGVSLIVAMLTAGRKEKILGKFTKGFGAAYGVINYASDILSYARLYGLMLAGAVIADIVSSNSVNLISSGNVAFIILGVAIMLIGHIFNLAIGLLGAYIHDARLQYVEFYGRFYEGEGELFTPLGSKHKHVLVL